MSKQEKLKNLLEEVQFGVPETHCACKCINSFRGSLQAAEFFYLLTHKLNTAVSENKAVSLNLQEIVEFIKTLSSFDQFAPEEFQFISSVLVKLSRAGNSLKSKMEQIENEEKQKEEKGEKIEEAS